MALEADTPDHHRQRSEYIKGIIHRQPSKPSPVLQVDSAPKTIVQFWHDFQNLPTDVLQCIESWINWQKAGYSHRLFDAAGADSYIEEHLSPLHISAYRRCYHPAMQADYFRMCFLHVEGGLYVDADDVCIARDISPLFEGHGLKVQPLCYDIDSDMMVQPCDFMSPSAPTGNWIFYLNNNPLSAQSGDVVIERALERATRCLVETLQDELPEIQATTGPGNLSRIVFQMGVAGELDNAIVVLKDWSEYAVSKWPLSYRKDDRNWRNSNQRAFDRGGDRNV